MRIAVSSAQYRSTFKGALLLKSVVRLDPNNLINYTSHRSAAAKNMSGYLGYYMLSELAESSCDFVLSQASSLAGTHMMRVLVDIPSCLIR